MARQAFAPLDELTPREREVARLMARGMTNPQIAETLDIGFGTAKTHVSHVIAKLGVTTREEAIEVWKAEHTVGRRFHRAFAGIFALGGLKTAATVGAVVVAGGGIAAAALAVNASRGDDNEPVVPDPLGSSQGTGWEQLPDSPLSPRSNVVGVWTGDEALFVGGDTFICPPAAGCPVPREPPLADGAAFDPETETWREIAAAPVPFAAAETAVLGDDVYFLIRGFREGSRTAFLRYSIPDDSWEELPLPDVDIDWYGLIAAGDVVVAHPGSHEQREQPDLYFDPATWGALPEDRRGPPVDAWQELPGDPLRPSFDRTMAWTDGHLYLFGQDLPYESSSEPSLPQAARFDLASAKWEPLPESEFLGSGPWYAEGDLLVNPTLGSADGGEVNNWGRSYPYGGLFDTRTLEWQPLPDAGVDLPEGVGGSAGVLGSEGALYLSHRGGPLLDLESMTWFDMPALDPEDDTTYIRRNLLSAGTAAIAFGGERWVGGGSVTRPAGPSPNEGEVLDEVWIWRPAP